MTPSHSLPLRRWLATALLATGTTLGGACADLEPAGPDLASGPDAGTSVDDTETAASDPSVLEGWIRGEYGPRLVKYQIIDGLNVTEGDIELPNVYPTRDQVPGADRLYAAGDTDSSLRWPGRTVPFELHDSLESAQRTAALEAINHWNQFSSITLVERNGERDYVRIRQSDIQGCGRSAVGRQGGRQVLRLDTCATAGTAIHELGHAIGFHHEHTRTDRDDFVVVHWGEIESGASHNFDIDPDTDDIGPLDFGSIMMYPSNAFAKGSQPTMTRLDGTTFGAQRTALSAGDRWGVRAKYGLRNSKRGHGWFAPNDEVPMTGDFDGDGDDDIVTFVHGSSNRRVWVARSNGDTFGASSVWLTSFCTPSQECHVGDVNGDGRDDVLAFARSGSLKTAGYVWVALSNGSSFNAPTVWHTAFCLGDQICRVEDVNGDRRADLISFVRSSKTDSTAGDVRVALSSGSAFGTSAVWHGSFCYRDETCLVGDVDGDRRADIVAIQPTGPSAGRVWVALSTGTSFGSSSVWRTGTWCRDVSTCQIADMNGDGLADLAVYVQDLIPSSVPFHRDLVVHLSNASGFDDMEAMAVGGICADGEACLTGDINGDGLADAVAFEQGSTGDVNVAR